MITKGQITLIQTARAWLAKNCGVDEDTFRDLMEQETGVRSTTKIRDNDSVNRLMRRLEKLGFENTRTGPSARRSPDDPITRKQKWKIARNYEQMGYDTDERRQGFNRRQCGELPWGEPQTVAHGEAIIEGQKAILRRKRGGFYA
jgi:Protein of unknown function (DUF1018)